MRALVINCSAPHYNLGARKLHDWLQSRDDTVTYYDGDPGIWGLDADLVCLSVIFSWHAPRAREIALRMKDHAEVWCGGPGIFALKAWWREQTGLELVKGLDTRFDRQRGHYKMCFASRGCPVNCSFCIVPRLEGVTFTFDPDFVPAPILCDNNLSALPVDFQNHIVRRYQEMGTSLRDANSGFEPRSFDEDTYHRWKSILRGPWRFALLELSPRWAAGEQIPREEYYFMNTPYFETSAAQYAWLQQVVAIGRGSFIQGGVSFQVFAVR